MNRNKNVLQWVLIGILGVFTILFLINYLTNGETPESEPPRRDPTLRGCIQDVVDMVDRNQFYDEYMQDVVYYFWEEDSEEGRKKAGESLDKIRDWFNELERRVRALEENMPNE